MHHYVHLHGLWAGKTQESDASIQVTKLSFFFMCISNHSFQFFSTLKVYLPASDQSFLYGVIIYYLNQQLGSTYKELTLDDIVSLLAHKKHIHHVLNNDMFTNG